MEGTSVLLKYGHHVIQQINSLALTISFFFMLAKTENFRNMPESDPFISLVERAVTLFFLLIGKERPECFFSFPWSEPPHLSVLEKGVGPHSASGEQRERQSVFSLAETAWMEL